ncbi:MAG TPA: lysophospholipid acyltransferase family protein [Gammaproteobacteria bacterium]|nr:lysophospholipid acyltransferase family protein [Gammaproteobacteria bacterium]
MFKSPRSIVRFILLLAHLFWGVLVLIFVVGPDPERRNQRDWGAVQNWMARLCRILGIRVSIEGAPVNGGALFVSNHISWYDIPVLQSVIPTGFVAKAEIRGWPIIGWMAHRGNTLFIHRGKRDSFIHVLEDMKRRLKAGQNLLVFPEGTTSAGDSVMTFKTRFYEPAIEDGVPIQPIAVYYSSPHRSCAELAFVNSESFMAHMVRLLGEPYIDARVRFCEPVQTPGRDRRELGEMTQAEVEQSLAALKRQTN